MHNYGMKKEHFIVKSNEKKIKAIEENGIKLTDEQLAQVTGGTVENKDEKASITGTKENIETAVEKINYECCGKGNLATNLEIQYKALHS